MSNAPAQKAPALLVDRWFNTGKPLSLAALAGKVVVLEAFQMLCPGCVSHALPTLQKVHRTFDANRVAAVGLHTVFEHKHVMTPDALEVFIHEYRWSFPVGIDTPSDDPNGLPLTMAAYGMQGTPTTLLIDAAGMIRRHWFGAVDELILGAEIASLVAEADAAGVLAAVNVAEDGVCTPEGCTP